MLHPEVTTHDASNAQIATVSQQWQERRNRSDPSDQNVHHTPHITASPDYSGRVPTKSTFTRRRYTNAGHVRVSFIPFVAAGVPQVLREVASAELFPRGRTKARSSFPPPPSVIIAT